MVDCIRSTNLLLIPGMMCDERLWRHQLRALSTEIRVQVCSMVGARSIAEIATRILAAAPQKFALAGLSMGAIVAFEMWRQAPDRIERMALLDTNSAADAPERFAIRNRQIKQVQAGQLSQILSDELKPNYLAEVNKTDTALLEEVLQMGMDLGQDCFVEQSIALRDRADSTPTLATITCPVTIICGKEDQLCSVSLHEDMAAEIPRATLNVIEDCGHLSTLEQPEAVNKILRQWLANT